MGCKCSKVSPVIEPVVIPKPVIIPEPEKSRKPRRSVEERHSDDDDGEQLIDSLINNSRLASTAEPFVDIEDADRQAFDRQFLEQRQRAIDNPSYRSTVQSWRCSSLDQLVDTIRAFSKNKSLIDCHWIIFYWIAYNIEYDTVSYFSKNYADQSAQGVFRTKKGVCAGYGNIYKYICDALNIPCEVVSGYSKGYGFDGYADAPAETDHAWNAVQIGEHWYLMESTWGAGHLNEEKAFKRELNVYYFLPRPKEMIYHHLPENPRWQLLEQTVPLKQFWRMPKLHPTFFDLNLEMIYPRYQSIIQLAPNRPYALVLVKAPSDVSLLADLKLHGQKIEGGHRLILDSRRKVYCCYFAPTAAGKYEINIFGRRGASDEGTHSAVITLLLDTPTMPRNPISYPATWQLFYDLGLKVLSPKNTHLIRLDKGETNAQICIQTPPDVELLGRLKNEREKKIDGGHQVYFDRGKGYWRCNFAPNHDGMFEALIMAKRKSDAGSYTSAVSFKIEAKGVPRLPLSYPDTRQAFYDLDLRIDVPHNRANAVWPDNASFAEIRLSAPDDVRLSGAIEFNQKRIENGTLTQYDHEKRQWQLLFAPQRTGEHKLLIFAQRQSDNQKTIPMVVQLGLNVTKLRTPMTFPLTYTKFETDKCRIYEPLTGVLKRDAIVPFHCVIPGATAVGLQVDSKWIDEKGYADPELKMNVHVGSSDVAVYAKYGESTSYTGLIKYSVQ